MLASYRPAVLPTTPCGTRVVPVNVFAGMVSPTHPRMATNVLSFQATCFHSARPSGSQHIPTRCSCCRTVPAPAPHAGAAIAPCSAVPCRAAAPSRCAYLVRTTWLCLFSMLFCHARLQAIRAPLRGAWRVISVWWPVRSRKHVVFAAIALAASASIRPLCLLRHTSAGPRATPAHPPALRAPAWRAIASCLRARPCARYARTRYAMCACRSRLRSTCAVAAAAATPSWCGSPTTAIPLWRYPLFSRPLAFSAHNHSQTIRGHAYMAAGTYPCAAHVRGCRRCRSAVTTLACAFAPSPPPSCSTALCVRSLRVAHSSHFPVPGRRLRRAPASAAPVAALCFTRLCAMPTLTRR